MATRNDNWKPDRRIDGRVGDRGNQGKDLSRLLDQDPDDKILRGGKR